ncbi:hypothetical protein [Lysobacter olei]
MSTHRRPSGDRLERVLRSVLGLALAGAVVWAWVNSGPTHPSGLGGGFLP